MSHQHVVYSIPSRERSHIPYQPALFGRVYTWVTLSNVQQIESLSPCLTTLQEDQKGNIVVARSGYQTLPPPFRYTYHSQGMDVNSPRWFRRMSMDHMITSTWMMDMWFLDSSTSALVQKPFGKETKTTTNTSHFGFHEKMTENSQEVLPTWPG